jgi:hypothetical protein
MKKVVSVPIVFGIVALFLAVSYAPLIHATPIPLETHYLTPSRNTYDIENGTNLSFWICQLSLDGLTWISWLPFFG